MAAARNGILLIDGSSGSFLAFSWNRSGRKLLREPWNDCFGRSVNAERKDVHDGKSKRRTRVFDPHGLAFNAVGALAD